MAVAPLARGGMGSVELVLRREGDFRRLYARKRPHGAHERADEFRASFLREATLAGLLRHPNVVSVLDVGEDDAGPYLLMDFVEGLSLAKVIARFRAEGELIPLQVCLTLGKQIAEGLHAAHELRDHDGAPVSLVHRDVSPQNILLDFEGIARVTDFGLAKALGAGRHESSADALKGKLGYMSPEQLRFESLDRRSDLWAIGVVLYELLACERLYPGRDDGIEHVAREILDGPPPDIEMTRQDAPPALTELLFDLLAKRREDRPANAHEVALRLGEILREVEHDGEVIELRDFVEEHFATQRAEARTRRAAAIARAEATPLPTAPPAPRRRPRWIPALALAAGVALALGSWLWLSAPAPPSSGTAPPPPPAESVAPTAMPSAPASGAGSPGQDTQTTPTAPSDTASDTATDTAPNTASNTASNTGPSAASNTNPASSTAQLEPESSTQSPRPAVRRAPRRGARPAPSPAADEGREMWEWP
mgnify:CR=1 FL=1